MEEVIGIETRLKSYLVGKPQDYNFELHNLSYTQKDTPRVLRQRPEPYASFPQKINLSSQDEVIARQVEYVTATSGATTTQVVEVVILSHNNEHEFAKRLANPTNAPHITAWVKSPDSGFYSIPYTYQAGTHSKEGGLNPDFFLLVGDDVLPVEIKADDDMTEINRAKLRYARRHFDDINQRLEQQGATRRYFFKFLSPDDFTNFFHALSQGKHREYRSELETGLA